MERLTNYRCANFLYLLQCIVFMVICLNPIWQNIPELDFFKYGFIFAPRWWCLVLPLVLLCFWKQLTKVKRLLTIAFTLYSISYMGFSFGQINFTAPNLKPTLIVYTANLGNGGQLNRLAEQIENVKPHIVALQEANEQKITALFKKEWHISCASRLCTLSQFPIDLQTSLERNSLGGWGGFLLAQSITFNGHKINFVNVHLDTPRRAIESLLNVDIDTTLIRDVNENRMIEADIVSAWIKNLDNVIIAGDFNMPIDENIYRNNFSFIENAISNSKSGFNYTKYTRWHGIRIDHILYSNTYSCASSDVLEGLGGDHLPIIAALHVNSKNHYKE